MILMQLRVREESTCFRLSILENWCSVPKTGRSFEGEFHLDRSRHVFAKVLRILCSDRCRFSMWVQTWLGLEWGMAWDANSNQMMWDKLLWDQIDGCQEKRALKGYSMIFHHIPAIFLTISRVSKYDAAWCCMCIVVWTHFLRLMIDWGRRLCDFGRGDVALTVGFGWWHLQTCALDDRRAAWVVDGGAILQRFMFYHKPSCNTCFSWWYSDTGDTSWFNSLVFVVNTSNMWSYLLTPWESNAYDSLYI